MLVLWILINIFLVIRVIYTSYHVNGLLGGYGKGVWGGHILMEALDNKYNAWFWLIFATLINIGIGIYLIFY